MVLEPLSSIASQTHGGAITLGTKECIINYSATSLEGGPKSASWSGCDPTIRLQSILGLDFFSAFLRDHQFNVQGSDLLDQIIIGSAFENNLGV